MKEKTSSLQYRELQRLKDKKKLSNRIIGCLRTPNEKESLKAMAFHLRFNMGIITENHLTSAEEEALVIKGYTMVTKWGANKHKGGVPIIVDEGAKCRRVEDARRPKSTVDV